MKSVISSEKIPIKLWVEPDENCLEQVKNLANLPFIFRHVSLMPDSHFGYGVPIGSVFASEKVIIPNAVGLDIGCGVCVQKTWLQDIDKESLKKIMSEIRKRIPLGKAHHKEIGNLKEDYLYSKINSTDHPDPNFVMKFGTLDDLLEIVGQTKEDIIKQYSTLGGGNHFIEIQKGSDGFVYIMIHSGSRNLGKRVAEFHNKIAVELNELFCSEVKKEKQLAFLPIDSKEGERYFQHMNYCVNFAENNRYLMMQNIKESFVEILKDNVKFDYFHDVAHNYAAREIHFGHEVLVHRKGATRAFKDEICLIPGSQGTASYICKGLGNRESFMSCSHGAGRKMGRKEAIRSLSLDDEKKRLDDKGILHAIRGKDDLEEAAGAYKDIEEVMKNQSDLVEIVTKLEPLAVIKG